MSSLISLQNEKIKGSEFSFVLDSLGAAPPAWYRPIEKRGKVTGYELSPPETVIRSQCQLRVPIDYVKRGQISSREGVEKLPASERFPTIYRLWDKKKVKNKDRIDFGEQVKATSARICIRQPDGSRKWTEAKVKGLKKYQNAMLAAEIDDARRLDKIPGTAVFVTLTLNPKHTLPGVSGQCATARRAWKLFAERASRYGFKYQQRVMEAGSDFNVHFHALIKAKDLFLQAREDARGNLLLKDGALFQRIQEWWIRDYADLTAFRAELDTARSSHVPGAAGKVINKYCWGMVQVRPVKGSEVSKYMIKYMTKGLDDKNMAGIPTGKKELSSWEKNINSMMTSKLGEIRQYQCSQALRNYGETPEQVVKVDEKELIHQVANLARQGLDPLSLMACLNNSFTRCQRETCIGGRMVPEGSLHTAENETFDDSHPDAINFRENGLFPHCPGCLLWDRIGYAMHRAGVRKLKDIESRPEYIKFCAEQDEVIRLKGLQF